MVRRYVTSALFALALLALPACITTGYVIVVYDDDGRMIRCVMLEAGDSTDLPEGERRSVAVRFGEWDDAFAKLGITRAECVALSQRPPAAEKAPAHE